MKPDPHCDEKGDFTPITFLGRNHDLDRKPSIPDDIPDPTEKAGKPSQSEDGE